MINKPAIVGVFAYLEEVVSAIESLKEQQFQIQAVYSPMRVEEIREAMEEPILGRGRFFTLTGAILGLLIGISLAWYTQAQWHFIVGGKPPIGIVPVVIPAFEFFILIAVLFSLGGLLFLNQMPRRRLPVHYDRRFSQDRFGIIVSCGAGADRDRVAGILKSSGAEEVREIDE